MFAMFSDDIIYSSNLDDIYFGKAPFEEFYLHIRDIVGTHSRVGLDWARALTCY